MEIKDDYTLPARANEESIELLNVTAFTRDCLRTENPVKPTITDPQALQNALNVLTQAGKFADQIRKLVIYESDKVDIDTLVGAVDAIHEATDKFEKALYREVPEDYHGEEVLVNRRLLHAALGAFGEQGEKLELLNQQIANKGELDGPKYILEAGDADWFNTLEKDELRAVTGFSFGAIWTAVIAKLRARLPGKFTNEQFLENRNEKAEESAAFGKAA